MEGNNQENMKKIDVQIDNLYVLEALFNLAKNVETTKMFTLLMLECVQCYYSH